MHKVINSGSEEAPASDIRVQNYTRIYFWVIIEIEGRPRRQETHAYANQRVGTHRNTPAIEDDSIPIQ